MAQAACLAISSDHVNGGNLVPLRAPNSPQVIDF